MTLSMHTIRPSTLKAITDPEKVIAPITSRNAKQLPTLVRTRTKAEHDLVFNQAMHILATELRDPHPRLGPIKLVPIALSIAKIAELLQDEVLAKQGARRHRQGVRARLPRAC